MLSNAQARRSVLIISGPSGAGKTTVESLLCTQLGLGRMISHTSRTPRAGEVDGESYFFVDHGKFLEMVDAGDFAEHAVIYGKGYGLSHGEVARATEGGTAPAIVILNTDGARQILDMWPDVWTAWIDADTKQLEDRMLARGDDPERLTERLALVEKERRDAMHVGYTFQVQNDSLDRSVAWFKAIITAMGSRT